MAWVEAVGNHYESVKPPVYLNLIFFLMPLSQSK